jgi:hypothetical protein
MSFAVAEQNFHHAARDGIDATLYWPGYGQVSVDELVLRHLLPLAHEGLKDWGVSDAVRERYLSVIEGRCKTGSNGATWQTQAVQRLQEQGLDRQAALSRMLETYHGHMHSNEPVHTWPLP